ncbi:uncharacterized protein [Rutidosis leptorrhynchoides]|uniref:uncharacterized protein n=1 Tax=Rutidosis leptorrhynchoides TaxID=125765 RepID=UPI003A9A0B04
MNLKVHKGHNSFSAKHSPRALQNVQDVKLISTIHKKKGFKKLKAAEILEKWQLTPITFPFEQNCDVSDKPLVISCKIANTGIIIMKIHVDTGSSIDLIYEQCFRQLLECIKTELKATAISLSGFAGESAWPKGKLSLKIELCDETDIKLTRQAQLYFYVIRSASRYNMLLGRFALRKLGIIPSTIHRMVKFTTCKGVATINSMAMQPIYATISTQGAIVECNIAEDKMVVVNRRYPDQKIKIGTELNEAIRKKIIRLLVAYMDVFAWSEQDMTGVPRNVAEHRLNANPALKPIVQKRRGMAPDRMKWLCAEVTKLVNAGILREVKYQTWVANLVLVKNPDDSWRMFIEFKDINKA